MVLSNFETNGVVFICLFILLHAVRGRHRDCQSVSLMINLLHELYRVNRLTTGLQLG